MVLTKICGSSLTIFFKHWSFCVGWCSQNAIRLEEKEMREKEMRIQIIEEAEEYKRAFHEKRKLNIETNKTNNREKEKVEARTGPYCFYFSFSLVSFCMYMFPN